MKTTTTDLRNFLLSTRNIVRAHLYTITLNGGGVIRYTSADRVVTAGGYTFSPGPRIEDSGTKSRAGIQVSNIEITMSADDRHQYGGVPILEFIRKNGLYGSLVKVECAIDETWNDLATTGPVGTYIRFSGRFSEVLDGGGSQVTIMAASWTELLNISVPVDVFQASCGNTLFDSKCMLSRVDWDAAGTVAAGTHTETTFGSNLATTAGTYNSGTVVFLTGANAGLRRTVRSQDASGNISIVLPLPSPPAPGDTFTAYPGCDLKMATCSSKFNNLVHFRGQPFIPVPETAV